MKADLIDEYQITTVPVILGNGIRLFEENNKRIRLELKGTKEENGSTKNLIWKTGDTMYYKKGVTDPDYCVFKFTATSGKYYYNLKTKSFSIK